MLSSKVAVALARSRPSGSNTSPSTKAMDLPHFSTLPTARSFPGKAGRRKLVFISSVGMDMVRFEVTTPATLITSSSTAVTKPPCTWPMGLVKSLGMSNSASTHISA